MTKGALAAPFFLLRALLLRALLETPIPADGPPISADEWIKGV